MNEALKNVSIKEPNEKAEVVSCRQGDCHRRAMCVPEVVVSAR
jgi:hypothetical protein